MKVKERKGWKALDKDFAKWYKDKGAPDWKKQKKWLAKELIERDFIQEKQLLNMWSMFHILTNNCSSWKIQSKILSFITLCMNKDIGEDLSSMIG